MYGSCLELYLVPWWKVPQSLPAVPLQQGSVYLCRTGQGTKHLNNSYIRLSARLRLNGTWAIKWPYQKSMSQDGHAGIFSKNLLYYRFYIVPFQQFWNMKSVFRYIISYLEYVVCIFWNGDLAVFVQTGNAVVLRVIRCDSLVNSQQTWKVIM